MSSPILSSSKYPYSASLNIANFVSIKLTSNNFLLWKTQVMGLLESQEMTGFIDGNHPMPAPEITTNGNTTTNPDYAAWKRSDRLVRGWITATLSEEVLGLAVGLTMSSEVWRTLDDSSAQDSQEREFYLTQQLSVFTKSNTTMSEYLRKFKSICDELGAIGKPLDDRQKVFSLLRGLGPGYESFVTIMLKPPIPSYKEIVPLLQGHETMRTFHNPTSYGSPNLNQAYLGQRFNTRNFNNKKGKQQQHGFTSKGRGFTQSSPSMNDGILGDKPQENKQGNTSLLVCQICHKPNHSASRCWYRYSQPKESENVAQAMAAMNLADSQDASWFPDTGASAHMTASTETQVEQ